MTLVDRVYESVSHYPKNEQYGLRSQTQRAAVSIPANIAEGHARRSTKEFLHHLSIALGSLAELETLLMIGGRREYLSGELCDTLLAQGDRVGRVIRGLHKSLAARLEH